MMRGTTSRALALAGLLWGSLVVVACMRTTPAPEPPIARGLPAVLWPQDYEGQRYRVGRSAVSTSMAQAGSARVYSRVGWRMPTGEHFNCHTQGIAVVDGRVVTSCTDRRRETGWLQIFPDKDLARFADGRGAADVRRVRLYDSLPHPAVGQGLDSSATELPSLVPIVHEPLGPHPRDGSRIDLRDAEGRLVCSVDHDPTSSVLGDGGLAAVAMTVHDGAFWILAVSRLELFVYRLDRIETGGRACGATLSFAGRGSEVASGGRWRGYQALALFTNHEDDVFLLASRGHRLDTWSLDALDSSTPSLERLASMRWTPRGTRRWRGVFFEGMTIEQLGPDQMRIWAMPHDYWRGVCRSLAPGRRCTRAVYVLDQSLRPAVLPPLADHEPGRSASQPRSSRAAARALEDDAAGSTRTAPASTRR